MPRVSRDRRQALPSKVNRPSGSTSLVGRILTSIPVEPELARNCTAINPCQQDTGIIRDAEIADNIVNECGRTELAGNIDIGENTENAIAAGAVTQVKSGTEMTVTIRKDSPAPHRSRASLTIRLKTRLMPTVPALTLATW